MNAYNKANKININKQAKSQNGKRWHEQQLQQLETNKPRKRMSIADGKGRLKEKILERGEQISGEEIGLTKRIRKYIGKRENNGE